jgi:CRISPR-associated protein Cas1
MLHQIIDIHEEGLFISLHRGFLVVKNRDTDVGKVSLDDIGVLIISAQGATITKNVLSELSERGVIIVLCGSNYAPVSITYPVENNYRFCGIIKKQIQASTPVLKQCWKVIIKAKLENQSKVLLYSGNKADSNKLLLISETVKSGDSDNREGYGAKMYFPSLFGKGFVRDRNEAGINAFLNYGYAVIRSSMIKALVSSGLQPALGIHHANDLNPFCLADDFIEIYRPLVDVLVVKILQKKKELVELLPEDKQELVKVLWIQMITTQGKSPVFQSMYYLAQSYVKMLESKDYKLEIPVWEGKYEEIPETEQV